jgi:hypothetical protein
LNAGARGTQRAAELIHGAGPPALGRARAGGILEQLRRDAELEIGRLLPVHYVVAVALRPAFFSIRRLERGHLGGAMVAGDAPGWVETVIPWSGGRRIHLLTRGALGEQRRASVEHAASRIVDVNDLEQAVARVFRHRVQRRIRGHATPDVWFEVG